MIQCIVLFLLAVPAFATVTNITVVKTTPTQAVISYTAPDGNYCTIEVSEEADYSPVAFDVDGSKFTNRNRDLNRADTLVSSGSGTDRDRVIIVGHRGRKRVSATEVVSLALANSTEHFFRLGCGASHNDYGTGTFTTVIPPLGNQAGDDFIQEDPDAPGEYLDLSLSYSDRTQRLVDPYTGNIIKRFSMPGDLINDSQALNMAFDAYELGTNWTNPSGALSSGDSGAYAAYSGTSQDWIYFRKAVTAWPQSISEVTEADAIGISLTGQCNGADCSTASNRIVEVQLTHDGSIWSTACEATLPNGSDSEVECFGVSGATMTRGSFWSLPVPPRSKQRFGTGALYNSGSSTTANFTDNADCRAV